MQEKFRTVICTLNSQYIHSSLAPWCLLAGIEKYCEAGVEARVVEGTINEKIEAAAQRVIAEQPQLVGFSCYIWNIEQTKILIRLVKEQVPDAVIVLGGPEVSYNADTVLRENPLVKYVLSGEGEESFARLVDAVRFGRSAEEIPGICFRDGEETVVSEPNTPCGDPPSPYTEEYLSSLKGRIAYLETSRGCPYSCAFCLSGRCGNARFFDLERTKKELLLLANSGTRTVKLVDRTFNANRSRSKEIFRFLLENYGKEIPAGVCFHFEIAGDLLDDETIDLLAQAPVGSMQLEIGLQSFNPKTLEAIHRKTDVERLKRNILRLTANGNLHIHIDLIAGLPNEGWQSFAESFNIAYALSSHMLQMGFLKLLHGAPMREEPEEFPCRYSPSPPYEVRETPWLSEEELLRLHHTEDALERLANSGRFRRTLEYLLQAAGEAPFDLFTRFGDFTAERGTAGIPLDDYCALVLEYFSAQPSVDSDVLRDRMICDRLAAVSAAKLPPALHKKEPGLKRAILDFEQNPENRPPEGVRRSYAVLNSERCVVYADYENRNPVTGEFALQRFAFPKLREDEDES